MQCSLKTPCCHALLHTSSPSHLEGKKTQKSIGGKEIQHILKIVKERKRHLRRDSFPSYAHCRVYYRITRSVGHSKRNQGLIQLYDKEKKVRAHFRTHRCIGLSAKYQLPGKQLSLRETCPKSSFLPCFSNSPSPCLVAFLSTQEDAGIQNH